MWTKYRYTAFRYVRSNTTNIRYDFTITGFKHFISWISIILSISRSLLSFFNTNWLYLALLKFHRETGSLPWVYTINPQVSLSSMKKHAYYICPYMEMCVVFSPNRKLAQKQLLLKVGQLSVVIKNAMKLSLMHSKLIKWLDGVVRCALYWFPNKRATFDMST